MFIAGLAVFGRIGVVRAGPAVALLIAARALQGIGGGIAVPLALALIIDHHTTVMRGKALGAWGRSPGSPSRLAAHRYRAIVEGLVCSGSSGSASQWG